ncbi:MAG TPA: hypothetical protein VFY84_19720 [Jiangellales bacterium]|nr:hypothetical protein [Jiangellales bacterium]
MSQPRMLGPDDTYEPRQIRPDETIGVLVDWHCRITRGLINRILDREGVLLVQLERTLDPHRSRRAAYMRRWIRMPLWM